jgi:hypothetical protein
MTSFELVAFDIETTGFEVDDEVTVIGFDFPMGARVFANTDGETVEDLDQTVADRVSHTVRATAHPSETALLKTVSEFGRERFRNEDGLLLVAYNGEKWQSGFDLPFLRTRLSHLDIEWPFRDVPYADLLPVIERRFNTTVGSGEERSAMNDLVGAYDTLIGGELSDADPFAESGEAVTAFKDGRYAEVVAHNVADIRRTRELGKLAQTYCSKSDIQLKSLTPTIHDD